MVIEQKFKEGEEPDPTPFLFVSLEMKRKDQNKPYDGKKACWVPCEKDGYVVGEITGSKGDLITVKVPEGEEKNFKKDLVTQVNPPKYEKTEDMSNLTFLNDGSVLHNLKQRYYVQLIYTYSGLFCIAINPYKRFPIYTARAMKIYQGKRRNEVPPHIFSIADGAYQSMLTIRENQSILITGESGAGKTENTKKVIAYFANIAASEKPAKGADVNKKSLEDQIVQTNPVLEAFGNAKTTRNDNSSRFGKFIRIHFGNSGKLAGADIETYLLEKARVISQQPLERSYHIFYLIMSGGKGGKVPEYVKIREQLCLLTNDIYKYHYVSQGKTTIPNIDDGEEFEVTHEAFDILKFTPQERADIYQVTSAVMHMGELKFKGRGDQGEPDEKEEGEICGKLLGTSGDEMYKNICKPRIKVGTEFVTKGQSDKQCFYSVGAMSKAMFDRMFKFIVKKCNETLDTKQHRATFIGVLDIAGFEIFDYNGFEQLCINFTNEKLQQFFNHHMFVLEQEEYKREGLDWIFEDFGMDLQACIDLMEKPMGVFSILEEQSMFPKATDQTFADMLKNNHLGKSQCFIKPKPPKPGCQEAHFACVHYAGTVPYNITGWLEKNKDPLNDTLCDQFKKSTNKLLVDMFSDHPGQSGGAVAADGGGKGKKQKGGSFITVSNAYREQLNSLMTTLKATHPHFIRCIIPNEVKTPLLIDSALVMHQLTCNGVLEGIRICRKGFPNRLIYDDFKHRYQILAAAQMASAKDDKKMAEACFDHIGLVADKWRVGHTKVFFRAGVLGELEEIRDDKIAKILTQIQSWIRLFQVKKEYTALKKQRLALEVCQRTVRSWMKLRTWPWWGLWKIIKPTLNVTQIEDTIKKIDEKTAAANAAFEAEHKITVVLLEKTTKIQKENDDMKSILEEIKGNAGSMTDKLGKANSQKLELKAQLDDVENRLANEQQAVAQVSQQKKKAQMEVAGMKKDIEDFNNNLNIAEQDIQMKEQQIRRLNDEILQQEELINKMQKEKKQVQDMNQRCAEGCQVQEDTINNLNRVKGKMERQLDELEDTFEREKKLRSDLEKTKKKIETDLKFCQESVGDLERHKKEYEQTIQRKDKEIASLAAKLDDEESLILKLQRQIKELQARIENLEEELESERISRSHAEKKRGELARELADLGASLEEAGGVTAHQIEVNKKREAELSKLRHDVEEANIQHESSLASLRKKHNDSVTEMAEQIENISKNKAKVEKERGTMDTELNDCRATLINLTNERATQEKLGKSLEAQVSQIRAKYEEAMKGVNEIDHDKKKLFIDNNDMGRHLEESESLISQLSKVKVSLATQLQDTKKMADEEARERAILLGKFRNVEHDLNALREQLEGDAESKGEILRLISKANSESQTWKAKYEGESVIRIEELDEAKRKLQARLGEAEETIESLNAKSMTIEKIKNKLASNLDEMRGDVERSSAAVIQMEKKQAHFDKIIHEWQARGEDLASECDASKMECRSYTTEVFRMRSAYEESQERLEVTRRENKNLNDEIKDLVEQISEGGKNVHEIEKARNRLQIEKEELQGALEEAESALESEENKIVRVHLELAQVRQEIDRRIQEKEEEFEITRKNQRAALSSMQASLDSEVSSKTEALRIKKKLEADINEMEISLDHSNKSNADCQKLIKRLMAQSTEKQALLDEEALGTSECREQLGIVERKANAFSNELEESRLLLEQADRARRSTEQDLHDAREQLNEICNQNANLTQSKRAIESEIQILHTDLEQLLSESKSSEEKAKKAMVDAARLADELRAEQEHTQNQERSKKAFDSQIRELQLKLDEAETHALQGGRKQIAKLEGRISQLEQELDGEQRRHAEAQKNVRKSERRIKELSFQFEEDKKNHERMRDLCDKLQQMIKTYKRQIEEAEEIAALNLAKYRKAQQEVEEVEERIEMAENAIVTMRSKSRPAPAR